MILICNEEKCSAMGEAEVEIVIKRIKDSISQRINGELLRYLNGIKDDTIKLTEIRNIARRIWRSNDIAQVVISFLNTIRSQKEKCLIMQGKSRNEIEAKMNEIKSIFGEESIRENIVQKCERMITDFTRILEDRFSEWKVQKGYNDRMYLCRKAKSFNEGERT